MYGVQIGALLDVYDFGGPLRIESDFRLGIMGNHMNYRWERLGGFGFDPPPVAEQRNEAVFLAEIDVVGTWQITQRTAFRAGYTLLWLDGVGMADDNFIDGASAASTFFAHGGSLGFEFDF